MNRDEMVQAASWEERMLQPADANLTDDEREPCYSAWTKFRDFQETDEDGGADLCSFRAGFIAGYEAGVKEAGEKLAVAREALAHYGDIATWANQRNSNGKGEMLAIRYSPCQDGEVPNGYDKAQEALKAMEVR